jgi:hypothetical protein
MFSQGIQKQIFRSKGEFEKAADKRAGFGLWIKSKKMFAE